LPAPDGAAGFYPRTIATCVRATAAPALYKARTERREEISAATKKQRTKKTKGKKAKGKKEKAQTMGDLVS
jgi:hypothetical protein